MTTIKHLKVQLFDDVADSWESYSDDDIQTIQEESDIEEETELNPELLDIQDDETAPLDIANEEREQNLKLEKLKERIAMEEREYIKEMEKVNNRPLIPFKPAPWTNFKNALVPLREVNVQRDEGFKEIKPKAVLTTTSTTPPKEPVVIPCKYGEMCRFGANCKFFHPTPPRPNQPRKTRMCYYVVNLGTCRNGDACKFAHSISQLTIYPCRSGSLNKCDCKCEFLHVDEDKTSYARRLGMLKKC